MSEQALIDGYILLLKASLMPPHHGYVKAVLAQLKAENPRIYNKVFQKIEQELK